MRKVILAVFLLIAVAGGRGLWRSADAGTAVFPHELHDGAFESCDPCHAKIAEGQPYSVTAAVCGDCHEGDMGMSGWQAPAPSRNLKFDHQLHLDAAGLKCAACHEDPDADKAMAVVIPPAEFCLGCHGHGVDHFAADNDCRTCHDPLTAAPQVDEARIAAYPMPLYHTTDGFAVEHGEMANDHLEACATCHARENCETCHLRDLEAVRSLGKDERVAKLAAQWTGMVPEHTPGFDVEHRSAAATEALACAVCHADSYCEQCHDAPGFHARDFILRHGAEAHARDTDCASCHSTEVFCRECHAQAGLSAQGGLKNGSYHDREPFWLLSHGQAGRQDLETCASCHQQTDCLQCHSASSGWKVNPHGPDFDPTRVSERNLQMCRQCHATDPRP
jgi:hypothetical protein